MSIPPVSTEAEQLARIIAVDIARTLSRSSELWCQGDTLQLRDGRRANCLLNHITQRVDPWDKAIAEVFERACGGFVQSWNDAPGRRVQDVIRLCWSVGV